MRKSRLTSLALLGTLAALAAGLEPPPAERADAAFPGSNGRIAFDNLRSAEGIASIKPNGNGRRLLTSRGGTAVYSPSGRRIAFVSGKSRAHIFTMGTGGKHRTQLTRGRGSELSPAWSPGGRRIVYSRQRDARDPEIYRMHADGSRRQRLTDNGAWDLDPDWSPDGNKIAFVRNRRSGQQEIWTMHADGSHARALTDTSGRYENSPDFSPNGKRIVFAAGPSRESSRDSEIYTMKVNGSRVRRLTPDHPAAVRPAWSPNGERIAFSRRGELFHMQASGERKRRVAGAAIAADWQPR